MVKEFSLDTTGSSMEVNEGENGTSIILRGYNGEVEFSFYMLDQDWQVTGRRLTDFTYSRRMFWLLYNKVIGPNTFANESLEFSKRIIGYLASIGVTNFWKVKEISKALSGCKGMDYNYQDPKDDGSAGGILLNTMTPNQLRDVIVYQMQNPKRPCSNCRKLQQKIRRSRKPVYKINQVINSRMTG